MLEVTGYTSGRIAIANLDAVIASLERRCLDGGSIEERVELSRLFFLRGDILGRISDHDRAETAALEAIALTNDLGASFLIHAQILGRFHRFAEAKAMLRRAIEAGHAPLPVAAEKAALLQATGLYADALLIRRRLADVQPGIHTLGALATLLAEMGEWTQAQICYTAALDLDHGVSPLPCAQLLFEWGVNAMRRGDLDAAESRFATLDLIVPDHVPGRGHRAEVALERGQLDRALALITPVLDIADDPEYRATYAQILAARGQHDAAAQGAERAALAYEKLLARRPEAYADHAAALFMGIGNRPQRALELAAANWRLRDTPRARRLLSRAQRAVSAEALMQRVA